VTRNAAQRRSWTFYEAIKVASAHFQRILLNVGNVLTKGFLTIWNNKKLGKKIFINTVLFVLVSLLCVIIAEIFVRTVFPQYFDFQSIIIPSEITLRTLKPNIREKLIHPANLEPPFHVSTNSSGLRSDREISYQAPKDTRRILCLGDSYTFGFGVETHETYPMYLGEILNSHLNKNHRYEILNAGFANGMTTDSQYLYLREIGLKFSPDVVTLGFCIANDLLDMARHQWVINKEELLVKITDPIDKILPVFIRRTALFAALRIHLMPPKVIEHNVDLSLLKKVKYLLTKITELSQEKDFHFLLILIPVKPLVTGNAGKGAWNDIRNELLIFCKEKEIACLDLLDELEPHHFFSEKVHFTKEGNRRVAELIHATFPEEYFQNE